MQAKVTGEYYRVETAPSHHAQYDGPFASPVEAIKHAMRLHVEDKFVGDVQRVTTHEPAQSGFGETVIETVTGRIKVPGPRSWDHDPNMSRYNPVNGWVIPKTIEIKTIFQI